MESALNTTVITHTELYHKGQENWNVLLCVSLIMCTVLYCTCWEVITHTELYHKGQENWNVLLCVSLIMCTVLYCTCWEVITHTELYHKGQENWNVLLCVSLIMCTVLYCTCWEVYWVRDIDIHMWVFCGSCVAGNRPGTFVPTAEADRCHGEAEQLQCCVY